MRKTLAIMLGSALLLGASALSAATVTPFSLPVQFSFGLDEVHTTFTTPVGGTYKARLVDFNLPSSFETLKLILVDADKLTLVDTLDAAGGASSFLFNALAGDNFGVAIAANAGGILDLGSFGASVSLVPIPAAALLFGSALLLLVRRRV
jgi:hypothetical protein